MVTKDYVDCFIWKAPEARMCPTKQWNQLCLLWP